MLRGGYLLVAVSLLGFFLISFSSALEFNGTTLDENGNALNNTLINITIRDPAGFTIVGYNSTNSNSSGWFNLTLPDNPTWMYELKMTHNNGSYVDYVGQNMPAFPGQVISSIAGTTFFLLEAGTINITAVNASGAPMTFSYQLKDQKLGYEVSSNMENMNSGGVSEVVVTVPKNRNYSIMIFPNASMPATYSWNNFSSTSSYNFPDGLSSYNATTRTLHKKFNMTMGHGHVAGYISVSGITVWDSFSVIAYLLEPGDMVHSEFGDLPYNLSSFFDAGSGGSDVYNLSTGITNHAGFYNISLPSTVESSEVILFAVARNGSTHYGGFHNVSLDYATYANGEQLDLNFSYMFRLLGDIGNISVEDPTSGGSVNVSSSLQTFNLVNSSNSSLTDVFAHIESQVDYTSYGVKKFTWMSDVSQGSSSFSIPLLNVTGIEEMNVYASGGRTEYAPLRLSWTVSEIGSNNNITLSRFEPQDIGGSGGSSLSGLKIALFKSNSTCDVPNPGSSCVIGSSSEGENFGDFNPLAAMLGGGKISFRMGLLSSGIIVHYVNVDMLASGPPDAMFDNEATESTSSGFGSAMRFGSQGPTIYDYVLVSMPYTEGSSSTTGLNESGQVNMSIPLFYDEDWNVIWNTTSNGTSGANLGNNNSHYEAHATEWGVLMGNTICTTNVSDFNATNPCYIDTSNNRIWIRLPHFSGTGPSITGEVVTASSGGGEDTSSGGGGGGGGGSVLIPDALLGQGYTIFMGKGVKVRMNLASEEHTLEVVDVVNDTVHVTISSEPQNFSLGKGDVVKVDVNLDGYYDLRISLTDIINGNARFMLSSIYEVVPVEESGDNFQNDGKDLEEPVSDGSGLNGETSSGRGSRVFLWIIFGVVLVGIIYYFYRRKYFSSKK